MTAPLFNGFMFIFILAVIGWIVTYKEPGSNAKFSDWFADHLWRKEREK
jgi:hypothetical protein